MVVEENTGMASLQSSNATGDDPPLLKLGEGYAVEYRKKFFEEPLFKEIIDWIKDMDEKRHAYFAAAFGNIKTERDNVKKFIVKEFFDQNERPLDTGTNGEQHIYDWGQVVENYARSLNIKDHPVVEKIIKWVKRKTNVDTNNAYVIYYYLADTLL